EDGKFRQSLDSQYLMIDGADVYSWTAGNLSYPFVAAVVTENNRLVFYTEGTNLWYLDVPDLEPIVAMALISYNDTDPEDPAFYYALLSDQGTLYLYEVYGIVLEDGGVDIDGSAMELGKVEAISFTDDLSAYSMTCSFGHVLDEEDNPNYDDFGLFIADNNSKGIYYVDMNGFLSGEDTTKARFVGVVEGAKNLSALFNDYYDSLTTEESEDTGSALIREFAANAEIISTARGQKVELAEATEETAEQPVTEEAPVAEETVTEEPVAEEATVETPAEEPAEQPVEEPVVEEAVTEEPVAEEPADQSNEATGTLNAVRGYQSSTSRVRREGETTTATEEADSDKADDDTVTITVTEEDLSNNGLYIVNYDAEVLEYVSTEYDRDYYSVNDSEEGTIKVSFADIDGFEAGEAIVTITFKKGCEDTVITTTTVENNEELGLSEESEIEVEGKGHFWGEPEWTWSADHTSATAKFTCENNEEHVVELTEKAIIEETKATTEKEGKRVYTVTVTGPDGKEYTIQYSEVIPKTVDTGDHSNIQLWTTMLTISIIAMAGIFLTMKRKNAILK
ncbi:MAG: hypothetical protein IJ115_10200, partial [Erysipelotrichaceae bacterium]|nr:hypothetical protein [Erysipelotrichaceae bacterium]